MGQSLSKIYVHIVFSTKHRVDLIDRNIEKPLFAYLGGTCKALDCQPIIVGGYRNHVHILCMLSKNITQAKLLEDVKKQSSKWIKTQGDQYSNFYWQNGYGIFSVSEDRVEVVRKYIDRQEEHHMKKDFKKEYLKLLKDHNIEYDERYIWD